MCRKTATVLRPQTSVLPFPHKNEMETTMNILREAEREVWVDGTIYQFKSKVEASGFEDMCRAIGKLHNALQLYPPAAILQTAPHDRSEEV